MAGKAVKGVAKGSVQSLNRALGLMTCLADNSDGLSLADLARDMELAPSTAHRLLTSLQALDYVNFDSSEAKWFVGIGAFRVGVGYLRRRDHIGVARQEMRKLVEQTGETSNLAVLLKGRLTFVAQIECNEVMRMAVALGAQGPLHASAVGKAILAFSSNEEQVSALKLIDYFYLTDKTHSDAKSLGRDLETVRSRGFAMDDEEQSEGLRCIGAPIFNEYGEPISAVSISGPTVRVSEERTAEFAEAVVSTAAQITSKIGGVQPN